MSPERGRPSTLRSGLGRVKISTDRGELPAYLATLWGCVNSVSRASWHAAAAGSSGATVGTLRSGTCLGSGSCGTWPGETRSSEGGRREDLPRRPREPSQVSRRLLCPRETRSGSEHESSLWLHNATTRVSRAESSRERFLGLSVASEKGGSADDALEGSAGARCCCIGCPGGPRRLV